jgi:hypothetical protein
VTATLEKPNPLINPEWLPIRTRPDEPGWKRTLGDAVIEWAMENLVHAITGEPWVPLPEHERFLNTYYQIDENGRWVYNQAYMRRARGTAKSPLAAIIAAIELCGPCRFGGWNEDGSPIAIPEPAPLIWIMATSVYQTKPIFEILTGSFSDEAIQKYGLTFGVETVVKSGHNRGRVDVVANNPRGLRGARLSCALIDETSELVDGNSGHASIKRINGNLRKKPGGTARRVDMSNAFVPGEDSVAERVTEDWSKQMQKWGYSHILLDSLEANPKLELTDSAQLREAIKQAAGDATWLDIDTLERAAYMPGEGISEFRREHLNQITSEEDSLIHAHVYDAQAIAAPLEHGDRITLGFDGSLSRDGTALVAFRLSDRSFHLLHYQEPTKDPDWVVDEEQVDEEFRLAMDRYKVWGAACDVHPFESWVYSWNRDFGETMKVSASTKGPLVRDNRSERKDLTLGCMSLVGEIESGKILFTQNAYGMKTHWLNAKRAENRYGFSFRKETKNSTKRVDIVAASLMAYMIAEKIELANIQEDKPKRGRALTW